MCDAFQNNQNLILEELVINIIFISTQFLFVSIIIIIIVWIIQDYTYFASILGYPSWFMV